VGRAPPGLHETSGSEEVERWADLARSTDFDGRAVSGMDLAVLKWNSV
jgi:hypothetical protein